MRPDQLTPLFSRTQTLEGIGPRLENRLRKLIGTSLSNGATRVLDMVWHFPTGINDRRHRPKIARAVPGSLVTLEITVAAHVPPPSRSRRSPYRIYCADETGEIELVFFHAQQSYLERMLPVGENRIVSGRIERFSHRLQMPHPDHIVAPEEADSLPLIEPVYPLTAGLTNKVFRKALNQALVLVPDLEEWQDPEWCKRTGWSSFHDAVQSVHQPTGEQDLLPGAPNRQRLAYDELLANQLALMLVRKSLQKVKGRNLVSSGALRGKIIDVLPFTLTEAQQAVIGEIDADMASPDRMLRLLQGDVGAGKTVVALLAAATAIENGTQAAIMAPTEVLARQHLTSIEKIAKTLPFEIALLTGREKGKKRETMLQRLADGEIDLMIGTHALFQQHVTFKDLGLAVIDEQHRFGVHQRLALQGKALEAKADVLVMTATPIPRTLLLTNYGDMDVSRLMGKPAGRKPIDTRVSSIARLEEIIAGLDRALQTGAQVYWVCPLVAESEKLDLAAAEQRAEELRAVFGDQVGLIHGRMKGRDKDAVMQGFAKGEIGILVATTVIEVGVDVPNASIMVIEHAERFGLSQLHQLRGRVGRGERASSCILLYHGPLAETARARLAIMRETEDGFRIAEEDLRLRGGGEVLGTKQSGAPAFRAAQLPEHADLLATARDDAKLILARDPHLTSARGQALKTLLYLFERDESVRLLQAG